jgi:hypothetical protein
MSLTASVGDGGDIANVEPPLGDKICCPLEDSGLRRHICTQLQLLAAVQSVHYPGLSLAGLYRLIVSPDRRSVVVANKDLLEAIGQTVEMYDSKQGAFTFPCERGIVVVLPMHIVGYAFAPDTEVQRQYGFTTIWHELAHVHAQSLEYWPSGRLRMPPARASLQLASLMWHEFFADRHSHWPGFSCDFERQLVSEAWRRMQANPTTDHAKQLVVDVARAYGRMGAARTTPCPWDDAFPQAMALAPVASAWRACADNLENACAACMATKEHPDLSSLELSSQALVQACVASVRANSL